MMNDVITSETMDTASVPGDTAFFSPLTRPASAFKAASAPASLQNSRRNSLAPSPLLGLQAASTPGSRRGSFIASKKLPALAPADVRLRRNSSATIGTAPTGRGVLAPANCAVHSYGGTDRQLSQRPAAPAATFGTASAGRGLTPRGTPNKLPSLPAGSTPLIGREEALANLPHTFSATFGTASRSTRPASGARRPHAYADSKGGQPRSHTYQATFGNEKRFARPCGVAHLKWEPQPLGLPMQPALLAAC